MARTRRVLILDEPTAILAQDETDALFRVIAQLRASGVAIVYISHRLDEIFRIADGSPCCATAGWSRRRPSPTSRAVTWCG